MSWNYRVLRHLDGSLALHEVYYRKGKPVSCTLNPVCFGVDGDEGLQGLIASLELALRDARERPILDVASFKPATDDSKRRSKRNASAEELLTLGRRCASTLKGKPIDHAEMLYDGSLAAGKRATRRRSAKESAFAQDDEADLLAAYERGECKPVRNQKAAKRAAVRAAERHRAKSRRDGAS